MTRQFCAAWERPSYRPADDCAGGKHTPARVTLRQNPGLKMQGDSFQTLRADVRAWNRMTFLTGSRWSCHVPPLQCVLPDNTNNTKRLLVVTHSLPLSSDVWVSRFSSSPLAFEASGRPVQKVFSLCAAVSDLVYIPDWRSAARAASVFFVGDDRDSSADGARRHVCKVGVTLKGCWHI